VVADLALPDARAAAIDRVRALGKVDALVNNAAECVYALPTELPMAEWRRLLEVNLLAAVDLVQGLAPAMGPDGHVVNVSSVTGRFLGAPRFAPYGLTKAALDYLSESLRLSGLAVSVVAPGLVDTPIYGKVGGFAATEAKLRQAVPRWLDADDVAEAVVWLLDRPPHVVVTDLVLMPRGQPR
jgi:NAD(P)-dependent dehydrogenase (short-subunit alcohol dehydrogenase family)